MAFSFRRRLPDGRLFDPPSTPASSDLGLKKHFSSLDRLLRGFRDEIFSVRDGDCEAFLDSILNYFNYCKAGIEARSERNVLHNVIYEDVGVGTFKRLLALGIDPDVPNKNRDRPSHYCAYWARMDYLEALVLCRPDLSAENEDGTSPADQELDEDLTEDAKAEVIRFFNSARVRNPPSLAQLAGEREWWAVKHLVRSGKIAHREVREKYEGKDVFEWAAHYREPRLTDELKHYFGHLVALKTSFDGPKNALQRRMTNAEEEKLKKLREENDKTEHENKSLKRKRVVETIRSLLEEISSDDEDAVIHEIRAKRSRRSS